MTDDQISTWLEAQFGSSAYLVSGGVAFVIWLLLTILLAVTARRFKRRAYQMDNTFAFDDVTSHTRTPSEFEQEVAALIQVLSGYRTVVAGGAGDGGVDIEVYDKQSKLVGVVQCKRYAPHRTVPPAHIRELNSVRHYYHVNIAYLVTTGQFSTSSYALAKELGIRLIDGAQLEKLRQQATKSRKPTAESR